MAKRILANKNPEYWKHTVKCPHCYGRGRVPEEGYDLTGDDVYKIVYEEEQVIAEVERMLGESRELKEGE